MNITQEKICIKPVDDIIVRQLSRDLPASLPVARILALRGLKTVDACKAFFDPVLAHFYDPFLFIDMNKAVDRIMEAINAKECITVYGDYDVDGITATAVLLKTLHELGADCNYYIPNRLTEGYGVSLEGITKLSQSGTKLIITVDCGINACQEVLLAKTLGMDVVITDHHEPGEFIPEARAILDPKIRTGGYPDDSLAGVGVALKLCHALTIHNDKPDDFWTRYLDFAAIGTAADIVPLTGENRVITKLGLDLLQHTANNGLMALIEEQGLSGKPLSTADVSFRLAPCINAAGRLGDSRRGLELLLTNDAAVAAVYARELKEANIERRVIDKTMQEEAFAWVESNFNPDRDYAIVIACRNWHCGVVGIVASKVVERYHRPAILFSVNEDGIARGSGRSIPALNLHKALSECSGLLENFGGHAAAAGMTIKACNMEKFRERFNEVVKRMITPDQMIPQINADAQINLKECTYPLFNILKRMEPFGQGNPRPMFLCKNLTNKYEPRLVGAKHLKMMVAMDGTVIDAVGFDMGRRLADVKNAKTFSLAFSIDENEWNGRKSLQMKVKGVET